MISRIDFIDEGLFGGDIEFPAEQYAHHVELMAKHKIQGAGVFANSGYYCVSDPTLQDRPYTYDAKRKKWILDQLDPVRAARAVARIHELVALGITPVVFAVEYCSLTDKSVWGSHHFNKNNNLLDGKPVGSSDSNDTIFKWELYEQLHLRHLQLLWAMLKPADRKKIVVCIDNECPPKVAEAGLMNKLASWLNDTLKVTAGQMTTTVSINTRPIYRDKDKAKNKWKQYTEAFGFAVHGLSGWKDWEAMHTSGNFLDWNVDTCYPCGDGKWPIWRQKASELADFLQKGWYPGDKNETGTFVALGCQAPGFKKSNKAHWEIFWKGGKIGSQTYEPAEKVYETLGKYSRR